jgi:hypothetical protein
MMSPHQWIARTLRALSTDNVLSQGCVTPVQVVHDFEHRGVNNDFLVRSGDGLALLYNDRSPHENHHLAASWGLMIEHNLLRGLNHKQKVCR